MATEVQWIPTNVHVYQAIYTEHRDALTVYGACTRIAEDDGEAEDYVLTEWGFKGASVPMIRSIREGTRQAPRWAYFIALVKEAPDGD